jgi:hypothetical protein
MAATSAAMTLGAHASAFPLPDMKGLDARPKPEALRALAQPWRRARALATRLLLPTPWPPACCGTIGGLSPAARRSTIFLLPEQNHGDSNLFIVQRSHGGMARITLPMAHVQVGIKTANKDSL